MKRYEGKVALVTGASSGIGAGVAEAFAKEGASLGITGRNAENLKKVALACTEHGSPKVVEIVADLAEFESCEKIISTTIEALGRIDVLVNNAGFYEPGGIETVTLRDFDLQFNVNLKAAFFLTQHATPHLRKVKGSVVNMSSMTSINPFTQIQIYGMTKNAMDYFTKCTALELASSGVRMNAVNPGWVRTNIRSREFSPEELDKFYAEMAASAPLGKLVPIEDVAEAVLYLASDKASMITGTCLLMDGGMSLKSR